MKICIPVKKDLGLESKVSKHFGSAPVFLVVDSETQEIRPIVNENQHHEHGGCRPLAMLGGQDVDAVVVGGIGPGAYMGLTRAGISVLLSDKKTVAETLAAHAAGELAPMDESALCNHGHGGHGPHGHGHGQGAGQGIGRQFGVKPGQGHGHGHGHGHGGCGHHHGD